MQLGQTNSQTTQEAAPISIFRLAFRPFFLFGALFSLIAIGLWVTSFAGWVSFSPYGGGLWWHSHEMLYGFVSAIVVGFLLTAVQNWSGVPGVKGGPLAFLVGLWLVARILLLLDLAISPWVLAFVDSAFLPVAAVFLAIPILQKKLYRNLFFVPLLIVMSASNFLMHWALITNDYSLVTHGSYAMVLLVTFLMSVMGGRVIPMFTANGTHTPKVNPIGWLEKLSIISMAVVMLVFVTGIELPNKISAVILFLASSIHLARFLRWRFWVTFKTPLVWSLHASYFFIPLGLAFIGLHFWFQSVSLSQGVHLLTVGAMGTMILAMISRVSLGHTGRMIVVGKVMGIAFGAIVLAALIRTLAPLFFADYISIIIISGFLWVIGFGLFFIRYFPVLTKPRVDGRPG